MSVHQPAGRAGRRTALVSNDARSPLRLRLVEIHNLASISSLQTGSNIAVLGSLIEDNLASNHIEIRLQAKWQTPKIYAFNNVSEGSKSFS